MTSQQSAQSGRDRRRFPRYEVDIAVFVRKKTGDLRLNTVDVSRHGAFLRTDTAYPVRQLIQLRFHLPDHGEIDAMCMVTRWLPNSPRGAGVGVDFFALSKDAKIAWERFVSDLKARDVAIGFDVAHTPTGSVALPPNVGVPMPAVAAGHTTMGVPQNTILPLAQAPLLTSSPPIPEWMAPNSLTARAQQTLSTPVPVARPPSTPPQSTPPSPTKSTPPQRVPPPPPPDEELAGVVGAETAVVMLRMPDASAVRAFIDSEIARGGMFLRTLLVKEIGEKVDVVLVHPETDEEFHLDGTVVRRVITGPPEQRGLGIFFRALGPNAHKHLLDFVEGGVEVVELVQPLSQRQVELESAVSREPDSAEALEALGSFLLDEEGDLGGALTALTRALVLGPSQVSIHAALARGYRRIGDHVKVRAHERVAEALMMFQDRMRVRLGVGDDEFP